MSTKKQREIWFCYIINQRQRLENEIRQRQDNVRFRDFDQLDCLEIMLAKERLAAFNEYVAHTAAIFGLLRGSNTNKKAGD